MLHDGSFNSFFKITTIRFSQFCTKKELCSPCISWVPLNPRPRVKASIEMNTIKNFLARRTCISTVNVFQNCCERKKKKTKQKDQTYFDFPDETLWRMVRFDDIEVRVKHLNCEYNWLERKARHQLCCLTDTLWIQ